MDSYELGGAQRAGKAGSGHVERTVVGQSADGRGLRKSMLLAFPPRAGMRGGPQGSMGGGAEELSFLMSPLNKEVGT